jgi:anti-sigma regulatory factor (Ser/Thr protein kinase)
METSRVFPARASVLKEVRRFLSERAAGASYTKQEPDLLIAVTEAAGNAIRHSGSDTFTVTWSDGDGAAEVRVSDQGIFKRRDAAPGSTSERRGIPLMIAVTDTFDLTPGTADQRGTTVRFTKRKRT